MNKIVFIIPYFGKFNNYFQLFLNSCKKNKDIADWLILTDDKRSFEYPTNVHVEYTDWETFRNFLQSKFDFKISVDRPYKLCDLKPMYGFIFYERIKEYKYWGHCDTDLIWGNLSYFLTDDVLSNDKIFSLGHCTLYKNTKENNCCFMLPLDGTERYKEVLSTFNNCSFDEEYNKSINCIYESYGKTVFYKEFEFNVYTKSSYFRRTYLKDDRSYFVEKKEHSFITWEDGRLYKNSLTKSSLSKCMELKKEEFLYIHMQSRPMKVCFSLNPEIHVFKIVPNAFEQIEEYPVTQDNFGKIKWYHLNLHYFRLRSKNLYLKIKKRIQHK